MHHYRQISYRHMHSSVATGLYMAWQELQEQNPVDVPIELIFLMDAPEKDADFSFKRRWRGLCLNENGTFKIFIRVGRFIQMFPILAHEYQHVIDRKYWADVKYSESNIDEAESIIENAADKTAWEFALAFAKKYPNECHEAEKASKQKRTIEQKGTA